MNKALIILTASLVVLLSTTAFADIPSNADLWAEQNTDTNGDPLATFNVIENKYGYDTPYWEDNHTLYIDNQSAPSNTKTVWLEIGFDAQSAWDNTASTLSEIVPVLIAPDNVSRDFTWSLRYDDGAIIGDGIGTQYVTWKWEMPQLAWEKIQFKYDGTDDLFVQMDDWSGKVVEADGTPTVLFANKGGDIKLLEVGTYCTPVPGSLLLCGIGLGLVSVVRRFRK